MTSSGLEPVTFWLVCFDISGNNINENDTSGKNKTKKPR
jgi:hypothetical protein